MSSCGEGKGTPEDAAKQWCECVEKNDGNRRAEDCVKMMKVYTKELEDKVKGKYYDAQEACLKSK